MTIVSEVPTPGVTGKLGIIGCPGKNHRVVGNSPMQARIEQDIKELWRWQAVGLVTLVETVEMQALGIAAIGSLLRTRGMWWCHLPIRDRAPPDAGFERRWATEGPMLIAELRAGQSFVLHCHAGLGRSGTVAARLLMDFGVPAKAAIHRVREARPGAIETSAQEAYLYKLEAERGV